MIRLTRKPAREPMAARPSRPMWTKPARWEYNSARDRKIRGVAMRTLARNMAFLMKSVALGKEKFGLPRKEKPVRTNFVR